MPRARAHRRRLWLAGIAAGLGGLLPSMALADAPPPNLDFNRDVAPLLVNNCLACHSGSDPAGALDLTRRAGATTGGDGGPALVAGKPDESILLDRVRDGEMPPEGKGKRLAGEEVDRLARWIAAGAAWPEDRVLSPYEFTTEKRAGLDWWSLRPPVRPTVPASAHTAWVRNSIDSFIAQALEKKELEPSPEADRATLLRRAKFDLVGLPPSPEEVDEFLADAAPDAYERLIERLLASSHYGERWGRHWLDVVRFGETDGYETNKPRANAWPYRDYVIRALNEDRPWPRFILEQLAGDQAGEDVATGFLVGGTHDVVGIQNIEGQLQQRANDLDDMLSATATSFLGVSAGCARCHDHKFDPITQRDYHALQAIFAGVRHGERDLKPDDYDERLREEPDVRKALAAVERRLLDFEPLARVGGPADAPHRAAVHPLGNVDRFSPTAARFVRFTVSATNQSEPCVDELEIYTAESSPRNVALASAGAKATASGVFADGASALHKLEHINDGRFGNGQSWISSQVGGGWVAIELPEPVEIDRVHWARDREAKFADRLATKYKIEAALTPGDWRVVATGDDRRPYTADAKPETLSGETVPSERAAEFKSLVAERERLAARLPSAGMRKVYAGTFEQPKETHRLHRGDPMQPREEVTAGSIAALGNAFSLESDTPEHERRLALARWIGDARNPLTARVLVNRLWHYHFGRGLVATPSNLGFHGGHPSHPELLDWLATELIERGWSVKAMHRLIMLSATYRQASRPVERAAAVDAGNHLLWRYPARRLEAEPIRDAILRASGRLVLDVGGPGYDAFESNNNYVHVYQPRQSFGPAEWRRMVYQLKPRVVQDATFGEFDCPDASQVAPRRNVSTTALQALNLLNSPFMVEQTREFAERVRTEAGENVSAQARRAFRLALAREPDQEELARAVTLAEAHGVQALCRALYNASEFVYVD
ncbi:MAG: PSD1 domain-containing protein [Planctomycetia bacterium]|nr:PSD1 domain-containing protein [Planctomycetia bacterium]